jgi:hypothetical protein
MSCPSVRQAARALAITLPRSSGNKKSREMPPGFFIQWLTANRVLREPPDVDRLWPLRAALDFERDAVPFVQRLETVSDDPAEMNEDIALLLRLDKTIALLLIEPLHSTFLHFWILSSLPEPLLFVVARYFVNTLGFVLTFGKTDLEAAPKYRTKPYTLPCS